MKGQPWTVEEEKQLREMLQAHKKLSEIAAFFGKSPESVKKKIKRLGLVVVVRQIQQTTTSNDLPSIEKALQKINDALVSLETPGLDQAETLRLRSIIQGRKMYIEKFAEFLNYSELEARLLKLEEKYASLTKKGRTLNWNAYKLHRSALDNSVAALEFELSLAQATLSISGYRLLKLQSI
jgi:hypothetical protein